MALWVDVTGIWAYHLQLLFLNATVLNDKIKQDDLR
jgi:hypothetical protein